MDGERFINSIGIEFVKINAGSFYMGATPLDLIYRENEKPLHKVNIDSFFISIYPITQFQYEFVTHINPSYFSSFGDGHGLVKGVDTKNFPVDSVSWEDSALYCERLSILRSELESGRVYRLPKEKEWEYACRAGTTTAFNIGDTFTSLDANISGLYPYNSTIIGTTHNRTVPVGQYNPNHYGLYDMHGNVWEWCLDAYYLYDNPSIVFENTRILRGGAWNCYSRFCRSAYRCIGEKDMHYYDCGFRIFCQFT